MSSKLVDFPQVGRAERAFREAFERLKHNSPHLLKKGTPVSQNNVAKEAGCDPSALRKSRYPSLIAEIQRWVQEKESNTAPSARQTLLGQRGRNRSLKAKIDELKAERDHAFSLLVEADAKIIELMLENAALQSKLPQLSIPSIRGRHSKNDT